MSNEEFDNLKEELMWEGSSVVMLSKHTLCIMNLILHTLEHSFAMNYYSTSRISIIMPGFFFIDTGADEQRFLEASMAYVSGTPILSDEEFDKLKLKLKVCTMVLLFMNVKQHISLKNTCLEEVIQSLLSLTLFCTSYHNYL